MPREATVYSTNETAAEKTPKILRIIFSSRDDDNALNGVVLLCFVTLKKKFRRSLACKYKSVTSFLGC